MTPNRREQAMNACRELALWPRDLHTAFMNVHDERSHLPRRLPYKQVSKHAGGPIDVNSPPFCAEGRGAWRVRQGRRLWAVPLLLVAASTT
jgi:hypothetical protein